MKGCKRCAGGGTKKGRLSDTGLVTKNILKGKFARRMYLLKSIRDIYQLYPELRPGRQIVNSNSKKKSCPTGYNNCTEKNIRYSNDDLKRVTTYAYKEPPAPRIPAEQKIRVPKGAKSITKKNTKSAEPLVHADNWGTQKKGKLTESQIDIMMNR